MSTILSMALLLSAFGPAGTAEDKAADPVGTWKCEYEIGGQQRTSTLKIKKDGEKLTGTFSWPDQPDEPITDLKFKDATLTFNAVRKLMGNEISIDYKLKVDADKLSGKAEAEFGGQKQEWEIQGKKEVK